MVRTLESFHSVLPVQNFKLVGGPLVVLTDKVLVVNNDGTLGTWDGTGNDGQLVANGEYQIKIDSVDNLGNVTTVTQPLMISRALTKTTVLIYNEAGEVIRHLYLYSDNPGNTLVNGVQLSSGVLSPTYDTTGSGVPSQLTLTLGNGVTLVWNGQNDQGTFVQAGQYFLEIHSKDGQGGEATITKQVSVVGGLEHSGLGNLTIEPNLLNSSNGYQALFTVPAGSGWALVVRVYTLAGELAHVPMSPQPSGGLLMDASNLASGVYIAHIEARSGSGSGLVQEKTSKILVLH